MNDSELLDGHIFNNDKKNFILRYKEINDTSLNETLDALYKRYAVLREKHPEKFKDPHEEYWSGYHS